MIIIGLPYDPFTTIEFLTIALSGDNIYSYVGSSKSVGGDINVILQIE